MEDIEYTRILENCDLSQLYGIQHMRSVLIDMETMSVWSVC